jgi:hypothetical protein
MSLTTDINFTLGGQYDGRISVAAAVNQPADVYMTRTSVTEIGHNDEQVVPHPTIDGLIRSGENHLLIEGSINCWWDLNESVTDTQRANFEAWFASNDEGTRDSTGSTLTYDSTNNRYTMNYTCEFGNTSWRQLPCKWSPQSDTAGLTLGANSSLLCFLRIDGEPDAWTVRIKDAPSGTTSTIDKAGNICYVIFSKDVTKDGVTLNAFQAYSVTSSSFDISAANDTKIVRLHRA